MNTRGPNGGKGASNQTGGKPTIRSTSYTATAGKDRGDTAQIRSRNIMGQKPSTSRIGVRKQAAVNKGPFSDFSTSMQNLGSTKGIPKQSPYNAGPMTSRNTQNSMGRGNKSE